MLDVKRDIDGAAWSLPTKRDDDTASLRPVRSINERDVDGANWSLPTKRQLLEPDNDSMFLGFCGSACVDGLVDNKREEDGALWSLPTKREDGAFWSLPAVKRDVDTDGIWSLPGSEKRDVDGANWSLPT